MDIRCSTLNMCLLYRRNRKVHLLNQWPVCLSVWLSISLFSDFFFLSFVLFVCLLVFPSVFLSVGLLACLSLLVCLFVSQTFGLSVFQSVYLFSFFFCLSLSVFLFFVSLFVFLFCLSFCLLLHSSVIALSIILFQLSWADWSVYPHSALSWRTELSPF